VWQERNYIRMARMMQLNAAAPEFELADFRGQIVRLRDFRERQNVLLVLNRGFI
jgi:hypothetical protein